MMGYGLRATGYGASRRARASKVEISVTCSGKQLPRVGKASARRDEGARRWQREEEEEEEEIE